ncbi:hypothetical protein M407DRAFT_16543 [Tulasnella calospora MUT 4182]|uniref:Amidohydrolase-related domain-containing protein n=1 Tax=Tulasnella calospora MUT 4182 TaxID=1051891 RepID=A0A0C3LKD2_9AGAM|nr:hypothetical protein M407DRAFT_16543 [Tulasnella calospora MUT 4182]
MKSFTSLLLLGALAYTAAADELTDIAPDDVNGLNVTQIIVDSSNSGIDLSLLNCTTDALDFINTAAVVANSTTTRRRRKRANTGNGIDVHSHLVFPWYQDLVPTTGGNPTPDWTLEDHLSFSAGLSITKTILGNSAPQANVYFGNKALTVALARLLNISVAAIRSLYPKKFDFFCVVPLPYVSDAIAEAKYCLDTLGGVGITTMTNHEGLYLGNSALDGFWSYVNSRTDKPIVYVHPTTPYLKVNGKYVEANPTLYMPGLVEFYFETARCYMDLSYSGVLTKYTNIRWIAAHVGGAFPSILDRMIKSLGTSMETTLKSVYNTRVFWDSAGPTYPSQVKGLLGYGIPKSQLLMGTDFPYAPAGSYTGAMAGLVNDLADFTQTDINNILRNNSIALFGKKLNL